jgi:hypothetical protein
LEYALITVLKFVKTFFVRLMGQCFFMDSRGSIMQESRFLELKTSDPTRNFSALGINDSKKRFS